MHVRMCPLLTRLNIFVKPYIIGTVSKREKPYPIELLFRTLADRTRLRLLNLIAGKEICVCYFVEILGMNQPKISRHLAYLRRAGIVAARRQGRWMHYRLLAPSNAVASAVLTETLHHLKNLPGMQADLARLEESCCTPDAIVRLGPVPAAVSRAATDPIPPEP
jgi:ArsR family transcriptional regulator, arsenate/arsenite/antimonite-responsive transcriptional repressor